MGGHALVCSECGSEMSATVSGFYRCQPCTDELQETMAMHKWAADRFFQMHKD